MTDEVKEDNAQKFLVEDAVLIFCIVFAIRMFAPLVYIHGVIDFWMTVVWSLLTALIIAGPLLLAAIFAPKVPTGDTNV